MAIQHIKNVLRKKGKIARWIRRWTEKRKRDKDIVAASDCRGLIVFETLCGIYVMVDCIYYNNILL